MNDIKTKKLIYHLTSLKNIRNILIEGLKPRVDIKKFHDIADKEIIEDRKKHQLDSYVPFHWFSRNPFDGRVQKNFPNEKFVLITIKRELAQKENWKIILRHPLAFCQ
ncbi:DarT ssDNA thymidine ADP-ribosyltransferase family protein [Providencia stuartii]|nr:DarT ssDNA thymidine ADP-ribosyltransferase family protein [Providencia stuartii]MBQ0693302.1 DUF4433 domain-containing protein [Providencia stuartii]MDN7224612.1 DarT ssDNA thymidine ADP-ribosyltransferase family protein [Providencia stuartii]QIB32029.1 DUF4433 domain-containing protein [Providencia stuartii]